VRELDPQGETVARAGYGFHDVRPFPILVRETNCIAKRVSLSARRQPERADKLPKAAC
jgi:hypothetical protein